MLELREKRVTKGFKCFKLSGKIRIIQKETNTCVVMRVVPKTKINNKKFENLQILSTLYKKQLKIKGFLSRP